MRSSRWNSAVVGVVVVAVSAGCTGSISSIEPRSAAALVHQGSHAGLRNQAECPPRLEPAAQQAVRHSKIYVSDAVENVVLIYPTNRLNPSPIGRIVKGMKGPSGIALDHEGDLFVAQSNGGYVAEYEPGQKTPSRIIRHGITIPLDVAFDSKDTLYVSNHFTSNGTNAFVPGSVSAYRKNESVPFATITQPLLAPDGVAVDRADNLYIADYYLSQVLFDPQGTGVPRPLTLPNLGVPDGIAFDSGGHLTESNYNGYVNRYNPTSSVVIRSLRGFNVPDYLAFDEDGEMYVPNSTGPGNVEVFRRGECAPYNIIKKGLVSPGGVAVHE